MGMGSQEGNRLNGWARMGERIVTSGTRSPWIVYYGLYCTYSRFLHRDEGGV